METMAEQTSELAALRADVIIKNHIITAMAAGLVPFPIVDVVAVAMIEVDMITELAAAYSFPFPGRLIAYKLLISLVGAIGPVALSLQFKGAVRSLPLVGYAVFVGAISLSSGISVYAVGKIFQKHFESGGTFLSSDNIVLRKFFAEKTAEGRTAVPALLTGSSAR
jgi:uncharacterized protein (DUF697 family)